MSKILITGSAGFIGFHLVNKLISEDHKIIGIDIINDYYDVNLKYGRLIEHGIDIKKIEFFKKTISTKYKNYEFIKCDLTNYDYIVEMMQNENFDYVVHLAAQAGVRYSIENPRAYLKSNIDGFISILEGCKISKVKHLLYASTSSIYGINSKMPLSENQSTEHPLTLYAATKKANEMMAHSYSNLFNIPTSGMRFFTVYGPWGRPDMALFLFTNNIFKGIPIDVFNHGKMVRDFTFVEDIAESIKRLIFIPPKVNNEWDTNKPDPATSKYPYRILNIGNSKPVELTEYINALEKAIGKAAIWNSMEIQPGDVLITHANTEKLEKLIHFKPSTDIQDGINKFVEWYKKFYKIKL
jgi:UDP-glucuronate 4-epimerase